MQRGINSIAAVVLGLVTTGCQSSPPLVATTASPTVAPSSTSGVDLAGTASAAADRLPGIGASDASWDRTRRSDPRHEPGSAYNPGHVGSGLGSDQYYDVVRLEGIIGHYEERFASGTSARAATNQMARPERPSDSALVWMRNEGTCLVYQYTSEMLAAATHGAGGFQVLFYGPDTAKPVASANVAQAQVTIEYDDPDDFGGC